MHKTITRIIPISVTAPPVAPPMITLRGNWFDEVDAEVFVGSAASRGEADSRTTLRRGMVWVGVERVISSLISKVVMIVG